LKKITKDYLFISLSLFILIILSWCYLFLMKNEMNPINMNNVINIFSMPMTGEWTLNDFVIMSLMWIVMMFAMMMPTTFSFLLIYHKMRNNMATAKNPKAELTILSFTYFLIWLTFSIIVCLFQLYLHNQDLVNMMGALNSNVLSGIMLILAGAFQFTSLKNSCLEKCRNPLTFIMGSKIDTLYDVSIIGFKNGIYCLLCCWALMLVLFVNGVMNLLWVVFITFAILSEKVLPFGHITSRFFGLVLVVWGVYLMLMY